MNCDTYVERRVDFGGYRSDVCAWCNRWVNQHRYIDTTEWTEGGPWLGVGKRETRVLNPGFLSSSELPRHLPDFPD
jgi:hypothetical protein